MVPRDKINKNDTWDLTRIYKTKKDFDNEYELILEKTKELISYEGKIMENSNNLFNVLTLEQEIDNLLGRLYIYAHLLYYQDMTNNENDSLRLKIEQLAEKISVDLSFVAPEMLKKDYKDLLNDELKEFEFMLEKMYRYQKYTLSEKEEKLLSSASNVMGVGSEAFSKYDNADIDLGYIKDEHGKKHKFNNQLFADYIRSYNRPLRKRAMIKMHDYYKDKKNTLGALYASNVKENAFFAKIRGYNNSLEKSLYADNVTVDVYNNLIETTHNNLHLLHKYMNLKKDLLNLNKMHIYDVYAEPKLNINEKIEFNDAKDIINESLKPLGEKYINDLQKVYQEKWIDIYPNEGKRSGAYQWGPYKLPYVSLNYNKKTDDVSTMAHELGHAMHTYYSDHNQSTVYNNYPIFLAEVASTVNEVLLSEYLIKHAKNDEEKIKYLLDFIEKFRATMYRQVMFAEFEKIAHETHEKDIPLTEELLSNMYLDLNKKHFGKNVLMHDYIKYEWMRIPHFYTSFYVYKYATGLASALSIASDILNDEKDINDKYMNFLASGCSKYPLDTLKLVNVDLTKTNSFEKAFNMFEDKLNELEILIKKNIQQGGN